VAERGRKAIIVGGGIGGLTAAIALRHAGLDVVIYERAGQMREVGAGLTMWPNAMKALARLGLAEAIWALGRPFGVGRILSWRGESLVDGAPRAVLEKRFGWPGTVIHRRKLLDALGSFLQPGELHLGARCVGFRQDARGVRVLLPDGRSDDGDLLVGADGLFSVVRSQLLGQRRPRHAGYAAYRGILPFELEQDIAYETWGCGARFGFVPGTDGQTYWWAAVNAPEGKADGPEGRKREVQRIYRGWCAPIEAVIEGTAESAILRHDIYDREGLTRWGHGRVTLLGDAAHPTTPNLGQGACLAMEDAVVLADCLRDNLDVPTALRRYERRRAGRANFLVRQSRWLGRLAHLTDPTLCWLRNQAVKWTPDSAGLTWLAMQFHFQT
jgi:2-polyprenyl-6-methoxyphenol hydroxylase-like FAD-dependent oxidoreductase